MSRPWLGLMMLSQSWLLFLPSPLSDHHRTHHIRQIQHAKPARTPHPPHSCYCCCCTRTAAATVRAATFSQQRPQSAKQVENSNARVTSTTDTSHEQGGHSRQQPGHSQQAEQRLTNKTVNSRKHQRPEHTQQTQNASLQPQDSDPLTRKLAAAAAQAAYFRVLAF